MLSTDSALAFDVYGTLADLGGLAAALRPHVDDAETLAAAWRKHQLEISWLLSLMGRYEDFEAVSRHALEAAAVETGAPLGEDAKDDALAALERLGVYPDAPQALDELARAGFTLAVLSNGTPRLLELLLERAAVRDRFVAVVSVDEVGIFKPAPAVYGHAAERLGRPLGRVCLVTANPFDCAGAKAAGMRAALVERAPSYRYAFAPPPDLVASSLRDLARALAAT